MALLVEQNQLKLGYWQGKILASPARFKVGVAGRRFGKTTLVAAKMFRKAVNKRKQQIYYIAPTYKMAKEIMWEPLKDMIPRAYWLRKNETELSLVLKNGSRIALKGADNPDSLRGPGLDDANFDEFADIDPRTWYEAIRPALADKQGTAGFFGTPKGFDHFYDLYLQGLDREAHPEWQSWSMTTLMGGRVPIDEVRSAASQLDPRVFRQEFGASFETLAGRVYGNFDRRSWPLGNLDDTLLDRGGRLYIGMDFNINPMSAVVVQEGRCPCCGVIVPEVLASYQLMTSDTDDMAAMLRRRYEGRKVIICPDASGNARHTSSPQGQTDFTILRKYGFEIESGKSNPQIIDRVNNTQSNLRAASKHRNVRIHPRATELIRGLEGLTWKEGTNQFDKKTGLEHIGDAFGYVLWQRFHVLDRLLPKVAPTLGKVHSPYPQ